MSGYFIAVEGLDGSGKSTQIGLMADWLRSQHYDVLLTAEPSHEPMGVLVRDGLGGRRSFTPPTMALLFASDRLDHLTKHVEPALARDEVVISDRYLLSSLAYQSVHNNPDWVAAINSRARPADLTILLDLPVEAALARLEGRSGFREIYEKGEILSKVRLNYLDLAAELSNRGDRIVVVEGAGPVEEIRDKVRKILAEAMDMTWVI